MKLNLKKQLHTANGDMKLNVVLQLKKGDFLAITGPSGSGKTTLLRLIAGLTRPDEGLLCFEDEFWIDTTRSIFLRPQDRKIGMVFQDYALFPNMTVRQNLEYALAKHQTGSVIDELIEITELQQLIDRYPARLSGGQQQRVALARALVRRPKLLLLDEPLSALDPDIRAKLQDYILKVHQAFGLTTILVSHDFREIFRMANRVVALKDGQLEAIDLPAAVSYANTQNGQFQLQGDVISIEEQEEGLIANVLLGRNIIRVPIELHQLNTVKLGTSIVLQFNALKPDIVIVKSRKN
ncbi:MAG: ABC transporter ATP-binding protein [Chitinophagales bacterium]|nr:ABC transporter ATP-binding protein [Chitinophagales bacterium]